MRKEIEITEISAEDQLLLGDMLYLAIFVPPGSPAPPREVVQIPELSRYFQHWGKSGDIGYLAVDSATRRPIGAAWLRLLTGENAGYGHVNDDTPELAIALLPAYRNQGIGSELMRRLISTAAGRYDAISLSVNRDNRAVHLYRRFGFETVGRHENTLLMQKHLSPSN